MIVRSVLAPGRSEHRDRGLEPDVRVPVVQPRGHEHARGRQIPGQVHRVPGVQRVFSVENPSDRVQLGRRNSRFHRQESQNRQTPEDYRSVSSTTGKTDLTNSFFVNRGTVWRSIIPIKIFILFLHYFFFLHLFYFKIVLFLFLKVIRINTRHIKNIG